MKINKLLQFFISLGILILIIVSIPFFNSDYKLGEKSVKVKSFTIDDIKTLYPLVADYIKNDDLSYSAINKNKEVIATFIVSNDFITSNEGYGGEINVLIGYTNGIVDGVLLLYNYESRAYIREVNNSGLFKKWNGLKIDELPLSEIDAVSGATYTSSAVIRGVKGSSAKYLSLVTTAGQRSIMDIVKLSLFAIVIMLSLLLSFRKKLNKFRTVYLLIVIVVSGFVLQNMFSMLLFSNWLKMGLFSSNNIMMLVILGLTVVMPIFGKGKFYCTFLCPMGALQEFTGKVSPFKKISLNFLRWKYFNASDIVLLFVIVAMFAGLNIDLTNIEPFSAFAITFAPWFMLVFGGVVVILSLFFNRPWCAVCPTGCAINHVTIKNR